MFKISTKGRYALRVMIDLAEHAGEGYVCLSDVAARQEISEKYLEGIVCSLARSGLVDSLRGKGGGYRLNRPPENYTVGSILTVTEGPISPVSCLDTAVNSCPRAAACKTLPLWQGLQKVLEDYFASVSLRDLVGHSGGGEYVI